MRDDVVLIHSELSDLDVSCLCFVFHDVAFGIHQDIFYGASVAAVRGNAFAVSFSQGVEECYRILIVRKAVNGGGGGDSAVQSNICVNVDHKAACCCACACSNAVEYIACVGDCISVCISGQFQSGVVSAACCRSDKTCFVRI